jgi:hypothetical protein
MIPTIGFMIGGYIILRCVEFFCRPLSMFSSKAGQVVMLVLALLVILATLGEMSGLVLSTPELPSVR